MDDAFKLARSEDSKDIIRARAIVKFEMTNKFAPYEEKNNAGRCELPTDNYDLYGY